MSACISQPEGGSQRGRHDIRPSQRVHGPLAGSVGQIVWGQTVWGADSVGADSAGADRWGRADG